MDGYSLKFARVEYAWKDIYRMKRIPGYGLLYAWLLLLSLLPITVAKMVDIHIEKAFLTEMGGDMDAARRAAQQEQENCPICHFNLSYFIEYDAVVLPEIFSVSLHRFIPLFDSEHLLAISHYLLRAPPSLNLLFV